MADQRGSQGNSPTALGDTFPPIQLIDALDLGQRRPQRQKSSVDALDLGGEISSIERRMPQPVTPNKNAQFYAQCMLDERTPKRDNALDSLTNAFTYVPEPYLEFLALHRTRFFFDSDDKISRLHRKQPGLRGMHDPKNNTIYLKYSNMETGEILHEMGHAIDYLTGRIRNKNEGFRGFLKKIKNVLSGKKHRSDFLRPIIEKHLWFKGAVANKNQFEWFAESWRLHLGVPMRLSSHGRRKCDDPKQKTSDNIRTYWGENKTETLKAIDKIFNRLEKDINSYLESQKERPWKYEIGQEVPKQELRERPQQQIESRAAVLSNQQKEMSTPLHDPQTTKRGSGFDKAVETIKSGSVQGKNAKERT